jgi:1,4-alpha-glucan branching enzyme/maltooligosyltrehalose trehalohydrolase
MIASRPKDAIKAIAALYLLAPQVPMMFMGEEWGAEEPFPYFCDFNEDLNEKVRKGRREELSRLPGFDAGDLLDPTAHTTFASAKLDWAKLADTSSADMLVFYKTLLEIRHRRIVPLLKDVGGKTGVFRTAGSAIAVDWTLAGSVQLHLLANLTDQATSITSQNANTEQIFACGSINGSRLAPWSVVWSISKTRPREERQP